MRKMSRSLDILGDRYKYDKECSTKNGWAQVDTYQDASYYGNWVNPFTRSWLTFAEGDVTRIGFDYDAEFVSYVKEIMTWYAEREVRNPGIDPGFNETLKAKFISLGLGNWLH